MEIDKITKEKIGKLQILEQRLQSFLMQKQTFQSQTLEIENAISELEKDVKEAYRIVGPIMISSSKEDLKKDLNSKKEILNLRIKNLEKQESKIKEEASVLQNEVMKVLQKKGK